MATETLRPNATGDETNIASQYPAEGEHWDKVDDDSGTADYVYTDAANYQRDLYNIATSSGSGTINSITVYAVVVGSYGREKLAIKSGTTISEGPDETVTSGTISNSWVTNPDTSSAWTWDDINSLQIGISLKTAGPAYTLCQRIYVIVDYTEAPTGTNQWINVDDSWRQLTEAWVNVDDSWRKVKEAWVNVNDVWRKLYSI